MTSTEAQAIEPPLKLKKMANRRVVVRGFTCDDAKTRDIDDAIWIEEDPSGGFLVNVSIADVASEVEVGSPHDERAKTMVSTKYYASGNNPMLPRSLSEEKLSLWPNVPKKTMTLQVHLSPNLSVTSFACVRSRLKSEAKVDYDSIPRILADVTNPGNAVVARAAKVAMGLLERRREQGAMALYDLNTGWVTTEEGSIRQLKDRGDMIGHIIVQEFMILANSLVAQFAVENNIPILFRNHKARDAAPDRVELMGQLEAALRGPVQGMDLVRQRTHMLLSKAEYGATVQGHYGLNLPVYAHWTSPIRRFSDLVNQRQFRAFLKEEAFPYTKDQLEEMALSINATLRAEEAARKEVEKAKAEGKAHQSINAFQVEALNAKDFERVTKVEARSGNPPSESFEKAFLERLRQVRVPLISLSTLFTDVSNPEGWQGLRKATIEYLATKPEEAKSLFVMASQGGWSMPEVTVTGNGGPAHAPVFEAKAVLASDEVTFRSTTKKKAEQGVLVALLAKICGVDRPLQGPKVLPVVPKTIGVDPTKDAISALEQHAQANGSPAPLYAFSLSGLPHVPVVTCMASYLSWSVTVTDTSKKSAKKKAATQLVEKLK